MSVRANIYATLFPHLQHAQPENPVLAPDNPAYEPIALQQQEQTAQSDDTRTAPSGPTKPYLTDPRTPPVPAPTPVAEESITIPEDPVPDTLTLDTSTPDGRIAPTSPGALRQPVMPGTTPTGPVNLDQYRVAPINPEWAAENLGVPVEQNKPISDYIAPKGGKKKGKEKPVMPEFTGTPEEIRLAQAEWKLRNLSDEDKGFGGKFREILANFLEGMSHANANHNLAQSLALGGVGVGGGLINPTWNERRDLEAQLPQLRKAVDFQNEQNKTNAQTADARNATLVRNTKENREANQQNLNNFNHQIEREQDLLKQVYTTNEEFDPTKPENAEIVARMRKANVPVFHKRRGVNATIAPNGDVIDTRTGKKIEGAGNFAKPATFTEKDITDIEFGLKDSKLIENEVLGSMAPQLPATAFKPEIVAALPPALKNADGSFNLQAFMSAKGSGDPTVEGIELSNIMATMPDGTKNQVAAAVAKAEKAQAGLKKQVARFRAALNHRTPNPNAEAMSLDEVKQWFKIALTKTPKELEEFFKILETANIR